MDESINNVEAFDGCLNHSFRIRNLNKYAEVICPQWPLGGVIFKKDKLIDKSDLNEKAKLAQELGCLACPYSRIEMSRSVIELSDNKGRQVIELSFEPIKDNI